MITNATQPITIPAIAPPESFLLLLGFQPVQYSNSIVQTLGSFPVFPTAVTVNNRTVLFVGVEILANWCCGLRVKKLAPKEYRDLKL